MAAMWPSRTRRRGRSSNARNPAGDASGPPNDHRPEHGPDGHAAADHPPRHEDVPPTDRRFGSSHSSPPGSQSASCLHKRDRATQMPPGTIDRKTGGYDDRRAPDPATDGGEPPVWVGSVRCRRCAVAGSNGRKIPPPMGPLAALLGDSPAMRALRESAARLLQHPSDRGRLPSLLIQGRPGPARASWPGPSTTKGPARTSCSWT